MIIEYKISCVVGIDKEYIPLDSSERIKRSITEFLIKEGYKIESINIKLDFGNKYWDSDSRLK